MPNPVSVIAFLYALSMTAPQDRNRPNCGWNVPGQPPCNIVATKLYRGRSGEIPMCKHHADYLKAQWGVTCPPLSRKDAA